MTHSKNSSLLNLLIWLKELNTFMNMTQRIEPCLKMSQRIEPCLKMTQRINLFSSKWLKIFVLWIWLRIDFFWLWLLEWYCFVYYDSNKPFFFSYDPKNWTFFIDWYDPKDCFFSHESQNRTLFWQRKNWTFFFVHDTKNWTFLKIIWLQDLKLLWIGRWNFLNLDQGIEAFSTISLKNDWPFLDMTLRVEPFVNMTHRIEPFLKHDS